MAKVTAWAVYGSMSGNTKAAAAIAEGAQSAGAQVEVKNRFNAQTKDWLDCQAVAVGSYEAFGYMGGGGKAMASIESLAQTFKFKKVAEPVLVKGKPEGQAIADLKALGVKLAAAAGK